MVTAQGTSSQIPVYKDEMSSQLSQENSWVKKSWPKLGQ